MNTSWVQPNEEWDSAVADFIAHILDPAPQNRFLESFIPLAKEVARIGAINSLSQTLLKLTSPGVPDIYQGNETWDFSLVDPDNRQPVDYAHRRDMLAALSGATPEDLLGRWTNGRVKLFLTQRLLNFRRDNAELFLRGSYEPLSLAGPFADCCVGFLRKLDERFIIALAPRLSSRVGFPAIGQAWRETAVQLPNDNLAGAWNIFTGESVTFENSVLPLAQALARFPFAVLTSA